MSERAESLLAQLLEEQRRANQLLALLIQALAEDVDPDAEPTHYMDGTPIVPMLSGK